MIPPLKNGTRADVRCLPWLAPDGTMACIVLVKQRYVVDPRGNVRPDDGAEVQLADVPWDEDAPEKSTTRYPSDLCLSKPSTDVVVAAVAMKRGRERTTSLDVLVRVGTIERFLRVHGPRVWYRAVGGLAPGPAEPFQSLQLRWEHAFGGKDLEGAKPLEEPRNPAGRGVAREADALVHQPAPQIEDPRRPITGLRGNEPWGVASIGRHWDPRRRFVGTYDEAWKKERMPLSPLDFDDRFNQCAAPGLVAKSPLTGGERVQLHNLHEDGPLQFELPRVQYFVGARLGGRLIEYRPQLDTVLFEPNQRTFDLTWRSVLPLPRQEGLLELVQVHEKKRLS